MASSRFLVVAAALVFLSASDAHAQFNYTDFSSLTGLSEVGDWTTFNNAFRLTDNTIGQAGGVWYETAQYLEGGFETRFEFQLSSRTMDGSDGLAFVIQSQSTAVIGGSGERLGYNEIVDEVAIEFDTYFNPSQGDPIPTDHIAVMVGSSDHDAANQPSGNYVGNLDFGTNKHTVRIVYFDKTMRIYLDDMAEPILSVSIDLAAVNGGGTLGSGGLNDGEAWVGLTASTGAGTQNHDILSWSFRPRAVTTVISHGLQGGVTAPAWTFSMADEILLQAGIGGTVLRYNPTTDVPGTPPFTGTWQYYSGATTPNGPLVLVFDWAQESDLNMGGAEGYAEAAADVLYAALRDPKFPAGFEGVTPLAFDLHLIGHSRGTVVHSEVAERLGVAGFPVEHLTTLDPHPVNGTLSDEQCTGINEKLDLGDSVPQVWTNVGFADNYFREDGNAPACVHAADFDGSSIPDNDEQVAADDGYFDLGVLEINKADDIDDVYLNQEHSKIHAWYHGTIDHSDPSNDGASVSPIDIDPDSGSCVNTNTCEPWYGHHNVPARTATGWAYSLLAADAGTSVARPAVTPGRGKTPGGFGSFSRSIVYNGNFETVDRVLAVGLGHAGWRYQGGSMQGVVPWMSEPNNYYHTLTQAGSPFTHNWIYIDSVVNSLELDLRVVVGSGLLEIHLVNEVSDALGNNTSVAQLGSEMIGTPHGWTRFGYTMPASAKGHSHRIELRYSGTGAVDVDNIHFDATGASAPALRGPGLALVALLLLVAGTIALRLRAPQSPPVPGSR